MKKTLWFIVGLCLLAVIVVVGLQSEKNVPVDVDESQAVVVHYFWSFTCAYCRRQNEFWLGFLERHPEVVLKKYAVENTQNAKLLLEMARERGAERYAGAVPMTFVEEKYFLGFDNADGVGRQIEDAVLVALAELESKQHDDAAIPQ